VRVGLELEWLAPTRSEREDLARAFARAVKGRLEFGFKFHGAGFGGGDRPDCRLTDAVRVVLDGKVLATFVDDPTLSMSGAPGRRPGRPRARTDDVRLALWVERTCWSRTRERRLAALEDVFAARRHQRAWVDPLGHPLVVWDEDEPERERVCEVVLAPLRRRELGKTLALLCALGTELGFLVPREGATHAHYDAAPFRSSRALRSLILQWSARRDELLAALQPNPRCTQLGPFPPAVVRVAAEADDDLPFATLCAALSLAKLPRAVDLNLLGLVERFPKQPTLEFRALPATLDATATLERLAHLDRFLSELR
jgi:hypothetical protein